MNEMNKGIDRIKIMNSTSMAVLMTVLLFLTSCAPSYEDCSNSLISNIEQNSTASDGTSNDANSLSAIVSGTLRLWMQTPDSMNPLVSRAYQWNEMSHLFYESLFTVNTKQEAIPMIAEQYSVSEDGLTYTVQLRKGILFHDNTPLDSTDVLATMQFIQNPANQSLYFDQLKNVSSVSTMDANSIQFVLNRLDPFFLYNLDFPILTSENVANPNALFQPGSGPYRIDTYEKGNQMHASLFLSGRTQADYKIKSILIFELKDTREAMEAFGDDRIDMVLLRESDYETYYLRNDVKIVRYPGNRYLFLEMNQTAGRFLQDLSKSDYIRYLLENPMLLDGLDGVFCTSNPMPLLPNNPLIHSGICKDVLTMSNVNNPFIKDPKMIEIIYMLNQPVQEKILAQVKKILERGNVPFHVTGYDSASYPGVIQSGKYDLSLREAQLPVNPDPSWLYLANPVFAIKGMETLKKSGTSSFAPVQTALEEKYMKPNLSLVSDEFCGLLNQCARYSPFIGVGFQIKGVMLSKRIHGQLESDAFNQYNNIKDVWVWSGQ